MLIADEHHRRGHASVGKDGGVVTSQKDPHGSHGFCLFNNVAIGAAYALHMYRNQGIKRVALLDFDGACCCSTAACCESTFCSLLLYTYLARYAHLFKLTSLSLFLSPLYLQSTTATALRPSLPEMNVS